MDKEEAKKRKHALAHQASRASKKTKADAKIEVLETQVQTLREEKQEQESRNQRLHQETIQLANRLREFRQENQRLESENQFLRSLVQAVAVAVDENLNKNMTNRTPSKPSPLKKGTSAKVPRRPPRPPTPTTGSRHSLMARQFSGTQANGGGMHSGSSPFVQAPPSPIPQSNGGGFQFGTLFQAPPSPVSQPNAGGLPPAGVAASVPAPPVPAPGSPVPSFVQAPVAATFSSPGGLTLASSFGGGNTHLTQGSPLSQPSVTNASLVDAVADFMARDFYADAVALNVSASNASQRRILFAQLMGVAAPGMSNVQETTATPSNVPGSVQETTTPSNAPSVQAAMPSNASSNVQATTIPSVASNTCTTTTTTTPNVASTTMATTATSVRSNSNGTTITNVVGLSNLVGDYNNNQPAAPAFPGSGTPLGGSTTNKKSVGSTGLDWDDDL